jgi:O-antigen ligase
LAGEIEKNETTKIEFYRPDFYFTVEVKKADLLNGNNSLEKLGIQSWKKSHNWRSQGFYGHYATYAEVLQLIASLVFGVFIALFSREKIIAFRKNSNLPRRRVTASLLLFFCLCLMSFALLLTVTRASQLAFMISAFSIVILNGNRKMILGLTAIALPVALVGLFFLQQSREVGIFDKQDESINYRETVWREGVNLWTENARNFTLGVGMDSIKRYAGEWRLFDDGKLPMGHFHSTPIQLVVERGFPALLLWLWILFIYARTLIRGITNYKLQIKNSETKNSKLKTRNSKENSALAKGVLL